MADADEIVIEALLDDVLDQSMLDDAVDEAMRLQQCDDSAKRLAALDAQIATVEQERDRLVAAITAGGQLDGLLMALQARERTRATLEAHVRQCVRSGGWRPQTRRSRG